MTAAGAQALARRAHGDATDRVGEPVIAHVAQVAAWAGADAEVVAWLHDTVEDGLLTFAELADLSDVDREALVLLTRTPDRGTYMDYIRSIAAADGLAGARARRVKHADLHHNQTRSAPDDMLDMRRPGGRYDRARRLVEKSMTERGEVVPQYD